MTRFFREQMLKQMWILNAEKLILPEGDFENL